MIIFNIINNFFQFLLYDTNINSNFYNFMDEISK